MLIYMSPTPFHVRFCHMISIYKYIDYRIFLSDWFTEKKKSNPRFSHRLFSRKMEQRSPSFLKDIIGGRRNITTAQLEKFYVVLNLDKKEAEFFTHLVNLDQAQNDEAKKKAFEQIAATRRFQQARKLEGNSYQYFSNWYCPAIREMAVLPEFQATPEWICQNIRPKITKKQAKDALRILQSLNMIEIQEDSSVKVQDGTLATPSQMVGIAVHNFHKEMLQLAIESIDRFHSSQRHLLGVTVNVPHSLLPELKEEMNNFAARICDICDSNTDPSEEVLQVNLHFYPLSQPKEET